MIVKRVFPSLIAQSLVSVQPMAMPAGLIFFKGTECKVCNTRVDTTVDYCKCCGNKYPKYEPEIEEQD